jgi:hypothetical protein
MLGWDAACWIGNTETETKAETETETTEDVSCLVSAVPPPQITIYARIATKTRALKRVGVARGW